MRVLVLTNQFAEFYGSEIVALEIAQWFEARGDDVTLGANFIQDPIRSHAAGGIALTDAPEALDLAQFDLIWCQHNILAQLPAAAFQRLVSRSRVPHVVVASLSPYEPYEEIDPVMVQAFSAEVAVNSPETGSLAKKQMNGGCAQTNAWVFHNAAPRAFWQGEMPQVGPVSARPSSILLVSNHVPAELTRAVKKLARKGIDVHHIGRGEDYRLMGPSDLSAVDAVISIGKTVPYAIATGTPLYMYDRFGGDGWLTRDNFAVSLQNNFSGRPRFRRLSATEISREIMSGYTNAAGEMVRIRDEWDRNLLSLDFHLSALRSRAMVSTKDAAAVARLREFLRQPFLSAQLDASRQKYRDRKQQFLAGPRFRFWIGSRRRQRGVFSTPAGSQAP